MWISAGTGPLDLLLSIQIAGEPGPMVQSRSRMSAGPSATMPTCPPSKWQESAKTAGGLSPSAAVVFWTRIRSAALFRPVRTALWRNRQPRIVSSVSSAEMAATRSLRPLPVELEGQTLDRDIAA